MEEAKLDDAKLHDLARFFGDINGVIGEVHEWLETLDDEPSRAFVAQLFLALSAEVVCVMAAIHGDKEILERTMALMDQTRFDHRICLSGLCTVVAVDRKMRAGLYEKDIPCC